MPDAVRCEVMTWFPEVHTTTMLLPAIPVPVPTPTHPSADPVACDVSVKLVLEVVES